MKVGCGKLMKEAYKGEIGDWYDDSLEEEKEMMLGKKAFGLLGLSLEFRELDKKSQQYIKKLFELDMPYEDRY